MLLQAVRRGGGTYTGIVCAKHQCVAVEAMAKSRIAFVGHFNVLIGQVFDLMLRQRDEMGAPLFADFNRAK